MRKNDMKAAALGRRSAEGSRLRVAFDRALYAHYLNAGDSFQRLVREPLQSLVMVLVVAMALALPAMLHVTSLSVQKLSDYWESSAQMTLFLKKGAKPKAIDQLLRQLKANAALSDVQYISPAEALEALRSKAGFGEALGVFVENPLPPVVLVSPVAMIEASAPELDRLFHALAVLPLVEDVQLDMKWLQRMHQILEFGRQVTLLLGVVLAGGVLVVLGNTIRLAVESRVDEIRVVKLVGGTNGFVRRPFLYSGCWYGVIGGLVAWIGVACAQYWLGGAVSRLALLYGGDFSLVYLGFDGLVLLVVFGGCLGLLGARFAVDRCLARLEL